MCGIAGILEFGASPGGERGELLRRMTRTLTHRGPDAEGYRLEPDIALGHRRLSIIDLATGDQPLSNEDGSVWVIFNGEIYNYRDLARELEGKGHRFATQSDTEAIVHAYEEWGTECLARLEGMFAFAVWDSRRRRLFLARDRLGKKPLYYAQLDRALVFGSELKALLPFPGLERDLDPEAISDFFSLLYVPAPKSIFRRVRKLAAGHFLLADPAGVRVSRYWDVSFAPRDAADEHAAAARLVEVLSDAVARRLRSDVPLGAFLSGGLDSSIVVGLMAGALPTPVLTSSIGFGEEDYNELPYARQVAGHFHTDHHEHVVAPDALEVLDRLAWHYDEPFGDASAVPTYYVSQLARAHVTVALSGDGSDESFAGYRRYYFDVRENLVRQWIPQTLRRPLFGLLGAIYPKADYLPQVLRGKAFLSNLARTPWGAYFHSVSGISAEDKASLLGSDVRASARGYDTCDLFEQLYRDADGPDPLSRIQYIDFKTYLPEDILTKVDRASMAHSLEVRCPFLDHRVVEYAAGLPSGLKLRGTNTKRILKEAFGPLLPPGILQRRKMGFVVPVGDWLRHDLRDLVEDRVLAGSLEHGLFDSAVLRKWWSEHRHGRRNRTTELWAVLMFNSWHARHARRPAGEVREVAAAPLRSDGASATAV